MAKDAVERWWWRRRSPPKSLSWGEATRKTKKTRRGTNRGEVDKKGEFTGERERVFVKLSSQLSKFNKRNVFEKESLPVLEWNK